MSLRHEYEHQALLESGQAGRARRLREWIDAEEKKTNKRQDDRVKVLVGAAVLFTIQQGHAVDLKDSTALLALMSAFLTRPQERDAVLGADGLGSPAFHRCTSL